MPFRPDEEPTRPEGFRGELRLMAERVLATPHADVAVLRMLRAVSTQSDADMARYMRACLEFVEAILGN
jgi:hypothetical protein